MATTPEASHTLVTIGTALDAVRAARRGLLVLADALDLLKAEHLQTNLALLDDLLDKAERAVLDLRAGARSETDAAIASIESYLKRLEPHTLLDGQIWVRDGADNVELTRAEWDEWVAAGKPQRIKAWLGGRR